MIAIVLYKLLAFSVHRSVLLSNGIQNKAHMRLLNIILTCFIMNNVKFERMCCFVMMTIVSNFNLQGFTKWRGKF